MANVMDLQYKYILLYSDCQHLLNNYEVALSMLSIIETSDFSKYNHNYEIQLHKAHYLKHLWKCNDALSILSQLQNESITAVADSLGILLAKYFIDDLHVDNTDKKSIEVYRDYFICAEQSPLEKTKADVYKILRNKPIVKYYFHNNPSLEELINDSNDVIEKYRAENNRLLANAYFLQGEIYRVYRNYDKAVALYKKSLSVTKDNNIVLQVNLLVYYLKSVKKFL